MDAKEKKYREEIQERLKKIFALRKKNKKFIPGKTWIQYGGGVFDDKEINASVQVLIDGWFGLGKKADILEKELANFVGSKGAIITNSGSGANLISIASIMSPLFSGHLSPGDEVITAACGFPTTVNPIVLYNLVPVFLDVNECTYNINTSDLEKALSKKTKAIMLSHTLGNPNEMDEIVKFCKKYNLLLIEDNCDALGSAYEGRRTGSFGILGTQSFYPPHHITMGEGGAIFHNDWHLERISRSLRDWGRMWCKGSEKKNSLGDCIDRFNYRIAGIPYDHKYVFNQLGFNLKPTESQSAMGVEQLKRMPLFIEKRKENFNRIHRYAKNWENVFILPISLPKANPCWFAYPLTIRDNAPFTRHEIVTFLEQKMIQTRPLFAGNITRQPAYKNVMYRKIGDLRNADRILFNSFFIGVYPGLGVDEIDFIAESISDFLKQHKSA